MTIAAALSNAASGLAAVSRGTELVSSNIANALTPGYGRRELVLAGTAEGGVRVASVARMVSASIVGDARLAGAGVGYGQAISQFHSDYETAVGKVDSGTALADKVGDLEAALLTAASRPDSEARLSAVATAARGLADGINAAATAIEDARTEADQGIASDVSRLKAALTNVARLNRAIVGDRAAGRDTGALTDERQRVIDDMADIVPIREVPRDGGRVALFTAGGATLLDGNDPIDLTFSSAGRIGPAMQNGTPPVSGLVMDGEKVGDDLMGLFAGGSLAAHFEVRDSLAPAAQASLDAFARDLVERFADTSLDPTLSAGKAGLFADGTTTSATAITEVGLANRISVTSRLPTDGSADWRLRDGLGATAKGEVGRATFLTALAGRLMTNRPSASTAVTEGARTAASFAADIAAQVSTTRVTAEAALARQVAHADALQADLLAEGVDTDAEMTRLLALEQAYAANARVIKAADEMLAQILEL